MNETDYQPPGVEGDAFGEWRDARKANGEDYTDAQAFLDHLNALGADWTDPHRYGFPRHVAVPEAPPAPVEPPPAHAFISTRFGLVPTEVADAIAATWPQELWRTAAEISYLESGWGPRARANTLDRGPCGTQYLLPDGRRAMTEDSVGLWQINRCAHGGTVEELEDPLTNAAKAYEIYQRQGWGAWYFSAQKLGLI